MPQRSDLQCSGLAAPSHLGMRLPGAAVTVLLRVLLARRAGPGWFSSTRLSPRAALQELQVPEVSHTRLQGRGSSLSPRAALEPDPGKPACNKEQKKREEAGAKRANSPGPSAGRKTILHTRETTDPARPRRSQMLPVSKISKGQLGDFGASPISSAWARAAPKNRHAASPACRQTVRNSFANYCRASLPSCLRKRGELLNRGLGLVPSWSKGSPGSAEQSSPSAAAACA